jgi:hypothetical protein
MAAINLMKVNMDKPLSDLETVRLIYTHKKNYKTDSTYAIHLSMDELQALIDEINSMNSPGKTGNGVTLYIGEYPGNYPLIENQNDADYSNRLTIVAVPTYGEKDGKVYFDFMDAQTVKDCKDKIDHGAPVDPGVSALDHFKLCPPDPGCNTTNIIWNNL